MVNRQMLINKHQLQISTSPFEHQTLLLQYITSHSPAIGPEDKSIEQNEIVIHIIIRLFNYQKKMLEMFGFDDNKKIGLVLLAIAALLYFTGIVFFFARSFLLLSNLMFIIGLYFFIGIKGILKFFTKKGKIKGSLVYFGGFVLIILNFGLFGALAQISGFILIFRTFLPDLYDYICKTPVVGSYLKSYWLQNFLDKLAGNTHNRI